MEIIYQENVHKMVYISLNQIILYRNNRIKIYQKIKLILIKIKTKFKLIMNPNNPNYNNQI